MTNVAEGAIQYFTNSICVDVWGRGCLTGLCVGARKGFVTLTVFLCVERYLLFFFRTEAKGREADRDLTVRISFRDITYFLVLRSGCMKERGHAHGRQNPFATAWECLLCLPSAHTWQALGFPSEVDRLAAGWTLLADTMVLSPAGSRTGKQSTENLVPLLNRPHARDSRNLFSPDRQISG